MQQWESHYERMAANRPDLPEAIQVTCQAAGKDGWQLAAVVPQIIQVKPTVTFDAAGVLQQIAPGATVPCLILVFKRPVGHAEKKRKEVANGQAQGNDRGSTSGEHGDAAALAVANGR